MRPTSIGYVRRSMRRQPRSSSRIPIFSANARRSTGLADDLHRVGALLIVVTDPIALGLFNPPGAYGADVVVADGQALGIPPSFGGPHLGIFATRMAHVRRLSGHLVGETVDADGRRGYVLTLATREQHIRRAKATSNICTNSALCALGAAVYLATMGKSGLRRVAELCFHKSHYAAAEIGKLDGFAVNPHAPAKPFFKEFVVRLPLRRPRSTSGCGKSTASSAATISATTTRICRITCCSL